MYKRLETFRGGDFQVKTITAGVNKELVEVMEKAERMEEYDEAEVLRDVPVEEEERFKQASAEFYNVLSVLCAGEALAMVRSVDDNDGIQAWHKLKKRFYPHTMVNTLRKVMGVVATQKVDMRNLIATIGKWEAAVREVEKELDKEGTLPEVVKKAALIQMCPGDIQDIIFQNTDALKTVTQVKERIISLVSNRMSMNEPVPMDIGNAMKEEDEEIGAVGRNFTCHSCGGKATLRANAPQSLGRGEAKQLMGKALKQHMGREEDGTAKGLEARVWGARRVAKVRGERGRAKARGTREHAGIAEKSVTSRMNVMQAVTRQTTLEVKMEKSPMMKKTQERKLEVFG